MFVSVHNLYLMQTESQKSLIDITKEDLKKCSKDSYLELDVDAKLGDADARLGRNANIRVVNLSSVALFNYSNMSTSRRKQLDCFDDGH